MAAEPDDNAAVGWLRFMFDSLNAADGPPDARVVASTLAEDHVFDDRRSGGVNFGRIDRADAVGGLVESNCGLTDGRPRWTIPEVVAIRGERCAPIVTNIDYGNGMGVEHIACWCLDTSLQRAKQHDCFDVIDALDVARVPALGRATRRCRPASTRPYNAHHRRHTTHEPKA